MAETFHEQLEVDYLADLLEMVSPEWRHAFLRFVETGEAEEDFLSYLDQDTQCQEAVEAAFNRQAEGFEGMATELKRLSAVDKLEPEPAASVSALSNNIAAVVALALQTPPADRDEVVEKYTTALAASVSPEKAREVKAVINSVGDELTKLAKV